MTTHFQKSKLEFTSGTLCWALNTVSTNVFNKMAIYLYFAFSTLVMRGNIQELLVNYSCLELLLF